jgi:hypothetical protein
MASSCFGITRSLTFYMIEWPISLSVPPEGPLPSSLACSDFSTDNPIVVQVDISYACFSVEMAKNAEKVVVCALESRGIRGLDIGVCVLRRSNEWWIGVNRGGGRDVASTQGRI